MTEYIVVPPERAGLELDEFLCLLYPEWNKGFVRRQVREGAVLVDGEPAKPSQRLRPQQVLILDVDEDEAPAVPVAPRADLPILYEDEDVLVVDKPADLAVEPERWARDSACVAGALLELFQRRAAARRGAASPEAEGPPAGDEDGAQDREGALEERPRIVHRLDKGTSGALLVAKDLGAERRLRSAFDEGTIQKEYLALVEGEHPLAEGEALEIELPLGPDERRSGRQVVRRDGKPARTRVRVEQRFRGFTLLRCEPLTGRTHQIRVHLAHEGFPLAVDPQYGRRDGLLLSEIKSGYRPKRGREERPLLGRLSLHAAAVEFPARDGGRRRVEAPLPKDLERALRQLEKVRRWRG